MNLKSLKSDKFLKAFLLLSSGTMIAQITTILLTPILTRIFSPSEFGIYTIVITAETLFGGIICARYDMSIVTEKDEHKVNSLIKLSFLISIIISLLAGLGYGAYYFILNDKYNDYYYLIIFIVLGLFLNGIIRILESYNNRKKEYKDMTISYVIRTYTQNLGAILLGLLNFGVFGFVFSHTLGLSAGIKRQSRKLRKNLKNIVNISYQDLKSVAIENYRQPLYSAPAVWANRFSFSSIIFFVESIYGLAAIGIYALANKSLGVPLGVISNNVSKIFYQQASEEFHGTGSYIKIFKKTSLIMLCISLPLFTVVYLVSPYVFEVIFGQEWKSTGYFIQALTPLFAVRLIVSTVANGLQVSKKQKYELIIQVLFIISSIICFILAKYLHLEVLDYLKLISLTFTCVYLLYYAYVYRNAKGIKSN